MYVLVGAHSPADGRGLYIPNVFMFALFCPEPKTHIGQPISFDVEESDEEDENIPDEEWMWAKGVTAATTCQLRRSL